MTRRNVISRELDSRRPGRTKAEVVETRRPLEEEPTGGSDAGGLAGLAEALELFATAALAGLLVVSLPAHFLPETAPLAELAEATDRFLNRLARPDP
jgi:hypothetical protein